jgi:hypothetical protein
MGEGDKVEGVQVRVSWFYRPEEAHGGRKAFHGEKELFTSDHYDWVAAGGGFILYTMYPPFHSPHSLDKPELSSCVACYSSPAPLTG